MKKLITLFLSLTLIMSTFIIQPVYVSASGDNLALGKPVTASSTHSAYKIESVNDGDPNTIWARGELRAGENFVVDLGEAYRINSVVLHTRPDVDQAEYRTRVALEFSNTPDFAQKERVIALGEIPSGFKEPVEVPISFKTPFRYVRAVKTDVFIFVLAEIEIYGELVDPNAIILGDDVAGSRQENAITLLSYLGLMQPVSEQIFGVDHLMTRAEAAQAVVDAFGGTSEGYMPFVDVPVTHKNYEGVKAAYNTGYITGDGTAYYRPNDYVTKQEMMYMTLRALGYGEVITTFAAQNLSTKIYTLAKDMELFADIPMESYTEPISRGDIAVMLYNALLAPEYRISSVTGDNISYEKGEDMLRSRYNVVITEGIVEENCISTLDGNAKDDDERAVVGGTSFVDPRGVLDAHLGKSVAVASYKDSGEIFYAWQTADNSEVVLSASSLTSKESDIASGKIVAENSDGKNKSYSLSKDFYVVKNGVADPYYKASDLLLTNGQLRLINNDSDSDYDVVVIEEYTLHYLTGAFSDDEELTIVDTEGNRKTVVLENLSVTDGLGKAQPTRKVAKDSIIKLYSTPDGENCRIILYNEPIDGELTSYSDTDSEIDGVTYTLSHGVDIGAGLKLGEAVRAFVDETGEILWIERNADISDAEWTVAFSQAYAIGQGLSADVRFRLYTQDAQWVEYSVSDKVTVDGVNMEKSKFASVLEKAAGQNIYDKELLRFKLNADGEIRAIDTIVQSDAEKNDGITFSKMDTKITSGMYSRDSSSFWNQHIMLCQAKADTPTFVLPVVGGKYTDNSDFDDVYRMSTVLDIAGNRSNKAQNLQGYMPDEEGYPQVFVTTSAYSAASMTPSGGMLTSITSTSAPQMVVEKVTKAVSADGEIVVKLKGRNVETLKEVSFMAREELDIVETGLLYQEKADCLSNEQGRKNWVDISALSELSMKEKERYIVKITDVGFGDIVRYQPQGATVRAVERIFDYNPAFEPVGGDAPKGDTWYTVGGNYPDYYNGNYRYQFGKISSATKNTFTLSTIAENTEIYPKEAFSTIYIFEIKDGREKVTEATDVYQFAGDESYRAMAYSNTANPHSIIMYKYE